MTCIALRKVYKKVYNVEVAALHQLEPPLLDKLARFVSEALLPWKARERPNRVRAHRDGRREALRRDLVELQQSAVPDRQRDPLVPEVVNRAQRRVAISN